MKPMTLSVVEAVCTRRKKMWRKARAEVRNDGITLLKQNRQLILEETGQVEQLSSRQWRVGMLTVEKQSGCGCGGTTEIDLV